MSEMEVACGGGVLDVRDRLNQNQRPRITRMTRMDGNATVENIPCQFVGIRGSKTHA